MIEMEILPAEQRVVVLPDEKSEYRTDSGIYIPRTIGDDLPETGVIVRVGKGSADQPMDYNRGDRVLYSQYAGVELRLNIIGHGIRNFKIMNQLDIMAKIKEVQL